MLSYQEILCTLNWLFVVYQEITTQTANMRKILKNFQNFQKRLKEVGLDYDNEDYDASSEEEDEK